MNKITGLIHFSNSLFCSKDSLGKKYKIKISNYPGYLLTPRLPFNFKKNSLKLHEDLKPPLRIDNRIVVSNEVDWGRPFEYPSGNSIVNSVVIEFLLENNNSDYTIGNAIFNAFAEWYSLLLDYLQILTNQDMSGIPTISRQISELNIWQWNIDNKRENAYSDPNILTVITPNRDEFITHAKFRKSINLCCAGSKPRIEYILLKNSINAFRRKDYRKTILDSATIIEIVLTNQLESILLGSNTEKFTKAILKKYRTLGNIFDLATKLDLNLPNYNYIEKVVEPRNKAIHKGFSINREEAKIAIKVAENLLNWFKISITEN